MKRIEKIANEGEGNEKEDQSERNDEGAQKRMTGYQPTKGQMMKEKLHVRIQNELLDVEKKSDTKKEKEKLSKSEKEDISRIPKKRLISYTSA